MENSLNKILSEELEWKVEFSPTKGNRKERGHLSFTLTKDIFPFIIENSNNEEDSTTTDFKKLTKKICQMMNK